MVQAVLPSILMRYNPVRTYPGSAQQAFVGATTSLLTSVRGILPAFTALDTKYVAKTGSDSNAGTSAAPYLTIDYARTQMAGAFKYVVISDSGVYQTSRIIWDKANTGLYAALGQTPTIQLSRGVGVTGDYGSRIGHPAGPNPPNSIFIHGYLAYVNNTPGVGNDGTGVLGDSTKPFRTIQAAVTACSSSYNYVRIMNSGTYVEDINAGAFDVNIQAAIGTTPTLINVATGAGNYHIQTTAGNAISLYGLNLQERADTLGTAVYTLNGNVVLTDCTISNGGTAVKCGYVLASNSYIFNCINGFDVSSSSTTRASNTLFSQGRGQTGYAIYSRSTAGPLSVDWCSFLNWGKGITGSRCIQRDYPNGTFNSADSISNSVVDGFYGGFQFGESSQGPTGTGFPVIDNCSLENGTYALTFNQSPGTPAISEILCRNNAGSDLRVNCGVQNYTFNFTINSFCSIGNLDPVGAIVGSISGLATFVNSTKTIITANNCTVVNAAGAAFIANFATYYTTSTAGNLVSITMNSCIEKGCKAILTMVDNNSQIPMTAVISGCVYEHAGTWVHAATNSVAHTFTYSNSSFGDAKLLSTIQGQENVGLFPDSPAMLSGTIYSGDDRGISGQVFEVTASGVTVNGIIFRAGGTTKADPTGLNLRGALLVDAGLVNVKVQKCSFNRFGLFGVKALSAIVVNNCEFKDASTPGDVQVGNGLVLAAPGSTVGASTCINCTGAGIVNSQPGTGITHVSTYGCLYGQYDMPAVYGSYTGNVYSQSGIYDYSGRGTHTYSCIGTVTDQAILTSCTRLDPLYRDPDNADLRLETVEFNEYAYNSPAKNLVPAGLGFQDAGAFVSLYKPLSITWTTFTLSYNPDNIERSRVPVKLSEDFTPGGDWYTSAEAYKLRYLFKWGAQNPMPAADLVSLNAMFSSSTGEVQVTFDNQSTWVPVRIERSTAFEYTDQDEMYNRSGKAQPLRQLALVESA